MKDMIRGFKSLGIIGGLLLQGALESMANTYEENKEACKEESLEVQWNRELSYYSDSQIDSELRYCGIYNYCVKYDGRTNCINKIVDYKTRNNYKVC